MQAIKRLEIIIDTPELDDILSTIEAEAVTGYTVIRDVKGRGDRGLRMDDGLSGEFSNSYILIACDAEAALRLVERVRPILRRRGGMCLVSDALWVKH